MRHEEGPARQAVGELAWHKGIPCESGACVEVAVRGDEVLLRSTVTPELIVGVSRAEWRAFLAGAKEGRFDHL